jgi:hypothetical protein
MPWVDKDNVLQQVAYGIVRIQSPRLPILRTEPSTSREGGIHGTLNTKKCNELTYVANSMLIWPAWKFGTLQASPHGSAFKLEKNFPDVWNRSILNSWVCGVNDTGYAGTTSWTLTADSLSTSPG